MKKYYKYYGDIGGDSIESVESALNLAEDFIEETETITKHDKIIRTLAKDHVHTLDTVARYTSLDEEQRAIRRGCLELIGAIEALKCS